MQRALSKIYDLAAALAGIFLIALLGFVLYSVGPGIGGWLQGVFCGPTSLFGGAACFGNPITYVAGSADEFAGYCMAASAFLALAATFGRGEHIRVTLILQRFTGPTRRALELWCLGLAVLLSGYLAWFMVKNCIVSWRLGDMSTGLVATPLWIPQMGLAIGSVIFFIAIVEKMVIVARGGAWMEDVATEDAHIER
jgi:TRAP-type C4-dicarboxylate transport system permease small subunit